jgi:hypothetical protein
MVLVPLPPGTRFTIPGVDVNAKFGAAVMMTTIVTGLVRLPEVPVMVAVHGATFAVADAVNVTVLFVVVLADEKLAVTPGGMPDAFNATVPPKPL